MQEGRYDTSSDDSLCEVVQSDDDELEREVAIVYFMFGIESREGRCSEHACYRHVELLLLENTFERTYRMLTEAFDASVRFL
jgi:hypothetical protein